MLSSPPIRVINSHDDYSGLTDGRTSYVHGVDADVDKFPKFVVKRKGKKECYFYYPLGKSLKAINFFKLRNGI